MFKAFIIGNLGADAEVHNENGTPFVSFKVAHNERYKDNAGNQVERSVWVSCVLNGTADGLRPYLLKGATVAVIGDLRLKTYHSAKMRQLVAGADMFVRSIDLVGARPDTIPSRLYDLDGVEHKVTKWYYCDTAKGQQLITQSGQQYVSSPEGWVTPVQEPAAEDIQVQNDEATAPKQAEVFTDGEK